MVDLDGMDVTNAADQKFQIASECTTTNLAYFVFKCIQGTRPNPPTPPPRTGHPSSASLTVTTISILYTYITNAKLYFPSPEVDRDISDNNFKQRALNIARSCTLTCPVIKLKLRTHFSITLL